jgi:hypothetical protein
VALEVAEWARRQSYRRCLPAHHRPVIRLLDLLSIVSQTVAVSLCGRYQSILAFKCERDWKLLSSIRALRYGICRPARCSSTRFSKNTAQVIEATVSAWLALYGDITTNFATTTRQTGPGSRSFRRRVRWLIVSFPLVPCPIGILLSSWRRWHHENDQIESGGFIISVTEMPDFQ